MVFISTKHFTIKTRKTFTKPFSNINLVLFSSGCFSGSRRSFYLVERDCSISMSRPSTSRSPPSNYPSTHWNSSIHLPHFDYFSFVMIFRKSLPFRLASLEAEKKADMFLTFKTSFNMFQGNNLLLNNAMFGDLSSPSTDSASSSTLLHSK